MKFFPVLFFFLSCSPVLSAQELSLPYATGNVQTFLETNVADQKPSIVLYNFDLESG